MDLNAEEKAILRFNDYLHSYGVEALNLVIRRAKAAEWKRSLFSFRFKDNDEEREKKLTEMMNEVTIEIAELDNKMVMLYGIENKLRTQILRDLKKVRGDKWDQEFAEE